MNDSFKSGYIVLTGRPNVGKSTLLNAILDQKIAIVTHRKQTTRNKIVGIKNFEDCQMIFVDTPGIHHPRHALGKAMVKTAEDSLKDIDVAAFVTDGEKPDEDREIIDLLRSLSRPVIFVLNKADRRSTSEISSIMARYGGMFDFSAFIPVSALKKKGIDVFLEKIKTMLPYGPRYYDDDMVTDQYERFMASEIIREKIIKNSSEEVPHAVAVEVQSWKEKKKGLISISADIYVEREGQKLIIIGKGGEMLKKIGSQARHDIEELVSSKVFLELWVKVKKGWRDDKKMLQQMGY